MIYGTECFVGWAGEWNTSILVKLSEIFSLDPITGDSMNRLTNSGKRKGMIFSKPY